MAQTMPKFVKWTDWPDGKRHKVAKRTKQFLPAQQCENWSTVYGPHEGCKEFAPGTDIRCSAPATHIVKLPQTTLDEYMLDFSERKALVCDFHKRSNWFKSAKVYRYRQTTRKGQSC